jgi:hypothetical protein
MSNKLNPDPEDEYLLPLAQVVEPVKDTEFAETDKARRKLTETNVKTIDNNTRMMVERIHRLEEEMMLCLRFMRVQAEKLAKAKDPNYKMSPESEN